MMVQGDAYAVLLSLLRNVDNANDALQESLLRMVRFLPGLRDRGAFAGWMMRLLVNQARVTGRAAGVPVVDVAALDDAAAQGAVVQMGAGPVSPRRAAQSGEIRQAVNAAIGELPEQQRVAIILFEVEQFTVREVARVMELSEGAVKFHLHEARKRLRVALSQAGVDGSMLVEEGTP